MLSQENKVILSKRGKSFLWRAGMMLAALAVDFVLENIGLFSLRPEIVVVVGLVLGEISKQLNSKK